MKPPVLSYIHHFKQKLTQRRDDRFYGYLTKVKLQRLLPHDADVAKADFTAFLITEPSYVEKWFNFSEDTWLFSRQPLSPSVILRAVTTKLNLIHKVNMNELYDKCSTAKPILKRLKEDAEDEWKSKVVASRWVAPFQVADLPNIVSIISYMLSIPASSGYVERIFSRMANNGGTAGTGAPWST